MKRILTLAIAILSLSAMATEYPEVNRQIVYYSHEITVFNFPFDKSDVTAEQLEDFNNQVSVLGTMLTSNPTWKLRIEGHTDETGTELYNLGLAKRRIDEMATALKLQGVNELQILRVPYGEINPLVDGHSDLSWKTNRRIVAKLIVPKD